MVYNNMCGEKVSALGFGCMRLPMIKDDSGERIDKDLAYRMLDEARDAGVNYFDTAYMYLGSRSEPFMGEYLSRLPRESYYLATKFPVWCAGDDKDDVRKIFEDQLGKLKTDHIDFYLMHSMGRGGFEKAQKLEAIEYFLKQKELGRIRHFGFSFHDDFDCFAEHIGENWYEFCQLQYNYMDNEDQAGEKGIDMADSMGKPVIVMEPVKGGTLANLPDEVMAPLKEAHPDWSAASWALRFAASRKNIAVTLSGMSTYEQVTDNLKTFSDFTPLSDSDRAVLAEAKRILLARVRNGCTGCEYCMPCPFGVNIPRNFSIWNNYALYGSEGGVRWEYGRMKDEEKADKCKKCGKCEKVCPQHLSIRENLAACAAELGAIVAKQ